MKNLIQKGAQSVVAEWEDKLNQNPYEIDLHGLKVSESLELLRYALEKWKQKPRNYLFQFLFQLNKRLRILTNFLFFP